MQEIEITCPHCHHKIPVSQVLYEQIKQRLGEQHAAELHKVAQATRLQWEQKLRQQQAATEAAQKKAAQAEQLEQALKQKQHQLQQEIDRGVAERLEQEVNARIKHELAMANLRAEREKASLIRKLELEKEAEHQAIELAARQKAEDELGLKLREKENQIANLRQSLEDARRRSELGSQELQGEVLEQDLEEVLQAAFPADQIVAVKKGARGADVMQTVHNNQLQACGQIVWEAKNARHFTPAWLDKLKDDQRSAGAALAVLVTTALPEGIPGFGQKDGVWITDRQHILSLATALRQQLMAVAQARAAATGMGNKMELLYDYLSGDAFRHRIEAIVESFTQLKMQIDKEKRAMHRQWKEREKQIERVMLGTSGMYGELQGIIGRDMPAVAALELDDGFEAEPEAEEAHKADSGSDHTAD